MATTPRFSGPTPFARLAVAHAASMCGDVCVTVSLAGSLFFTVPSGDARPRVLAYLALTMAPFAVIAPLLGPVLDRTRGGRRLVVFSAALGRAVLCWLMARHVDGLLLYPEAFGVLVLAKSHSIAKSSLVPAVVEHDDELVRANSNLALISVVAGFVGGLPAAAILKLFGARWSLLLGTMVFLAAAFLALQIPRAARVGRGETPAEREEMQTASIVLAGTAMALLRGGVGFLTFLAAFLLKDAGEAAWVYGAVLATSAIGGFLGVVVAPPLRRRVREEVILAGALLLPGIVTLFSARSPGRLSLMAAGFTVALGAASGRVGFDSLVQRDGPDDLHGRAFARFETRFQLVWVAGALIPVAIPLGGRLGLFVLSLVLGFGGLSYIGALRASRDQEPVPERPSGLARLRSHRSRLERSRRSEVQPPRDPGEPPGPSTAAP